MRGKASDLYAVIGHPVVHLRSPGLFNRSLVERGMGGTAIAIDVLPESLEALVVGLRQIGNLRGLLVTMPHKECIGALLDGLDAAARVSGAVNIVRLLPDGCLEGGQLDGFGFVSGMRANGCDPRGREIVMAGAGGVAAGIAYALADAGVAHIVLSNRTRARAESLAGRLAEAFPGCTFEVAPADNPHAGDVLINATSLGTLDSDPLPFAQEMIAPGTYVADVVNRPGDTPLVALARERGARFQSGKDMVMPQIALMHDFFAGA